jgi:hypothetical protein
MLKSMCLLSQLLRAWLWINKPLTGQNCNTSRTHTRKTLGYQLTTQAHGRTKNDTQNKRGMTKPNKDKTWGLRVEQLKNGWCPGGHQRNPHRPTTQAQTPATCNQRMRNKRTKQRLQEGELHQGDATAWSVKGYFNVAHTRKPVWQQRGQLSSTHAENAPTTTKLTPSFY